LSPGELEIAMSERKVKGAVITGYMKFIKKTWGQEGVDECLAAVGLGGTSISDGKWYDDQLSTDVVAWIADRKGGDYVEKCGRYTVRDLGLLSYIVRFMDIKSLLRRGPESYAEAFSYGYLKVEIGEKKAAVRVKGHAPFDKHGCKMWLGVLGGMLAMTKTKGRVIETKCENKGSEFCEFEMEWE